jgi:serine protease Do
MACSRGRRPLTVEGARRALFCAFLGAAFLPAPSVLAADPGAAAKSDQKTANETAIPLPSLAPLVKQVSPAVVNISVVLSGEGKPSEEESGAPPSEETPFNEFLRRFFEHQFGSENAPKLPFAPKRQKIVAVGSGFIIDPRGYIVTNAHVVGKAKKVTVILHEKKRLEARVVGRDPKSDVALLKIHAKKPLPYVNWGNSDAVEVGDWVVAVGNPFGLGGTVTAGIVSAMGRNISSSSFADFLQIDAPINRGNSGGPTFNLKGDVIGINTAIYSPSGGSVGIGFALPSNLAQRIVAELEKHGHMRWGWLGVAIQNVTPAIARSLGLHPSHPEGALVASVMPDSPAAKAGIKSGDVIIEAERKSVKKVEDLPRIVALAPIGGKLPLVIERNGKKLTIEAVVAEMPEKMPKEASTKERALPEKGSASVLGLELRALDEKLRRQLALPKGVSGVVVARVASDSPLLAFGIEPGDVIVTVDRRPVRTPQEAAKALKDAAAKGNILLLLNRHGSEEFLGMTIHKGLVAPGKTG